MSKFSLTTGGLLIAVLGAVFVQLGFSDVCSNQIINVIVPILGMIPGIGIAQYGRVRAGGINFIGVRNKVTEGEE